MSGDPLGCVGRGQDVGGFDWMGVVGLVGWLGGVGRIVMWRLLWGVLVWLVMCPVPVCGCESCCRW